MEKSTKRGEEVAALLREKKKKKVTERETEKEMNISGKTLCQLRKSCSEKSKSAHNSKLSSVPFKKVST